MALKWNHASYDPDGLRELVPQLTSPEMVSGFRYFDAQTDDARLVLRVLQEATRDEALALNYARVEGLLKTRNRVTRCGHPGSGWQTGERWRCAPGS